ncbi:MAG TPA: glutathione S-transferase [Alphaproteobacteria bacterium]|jgi:glutathione S-transferase|nr:glutathione S-transferase [Alphaproteobacteria bacterium]HAM46404.1 glutathione S-transferase [Alphaproteobacteria bacterium]HBA43784.1 glutathione S-transferase [Alphaproteobacteria bacterium]HBC53480.1 glutathione S-transferase [Alphaproteobacteria bacterium]HBF99055.1 glutathione S-transferase [Alphaproteobacteria bacterium]
MLTIWGRRNSYNVQKALWAADELALDYRHIDAGGDAGLIDTAEFLAMNPHGRVPVIQDGENIVWESHSVVRYLAATYGRGTLWAEDPGERARAEQWMDWTVATLEREVLAIFWRLVRTPADMQDKKAIAMHVANSARCYALLDDWLAEREWLAGERFTMGDIPAGTTLYRYFEMEIDRPAIPNVRRWYARLSDRPAYQANVMRPFDELRGKLSF